MYKNENNNINEKNNESILNENHKPHHKYKNIVFDLGGVLFYWNPLEIAKIHNQIANRILDVVCSEHWGNWDRGTMTAEEVAHELSGEFDKNEVLRLMQEAPGYLKPLDKGLQIFKEVKALGYKTYVLSNLSKDCYNKIFHENEFFKEFDGLIFSYQVKTIKPEPEIYNILLNTYSLKPEECLFIDDLEHNIAGANNIGIDGVVCKDHDYLRQELQRLKILD